MCTHNDLTRLAQTIAQARWELTSTLREVAERNPSSWQATVRRAEEALTERGDLGAVAVLQEARAEDRMRSEGVDHDGQCREKSLSDPLALCSVSR